MTRFDRRCECLIKQSCNLIALIIFYDENFKEEVALVYNPTSYYYLIMPTKNFHTSEEKNGALYITEIKNAFFIPSAYVEKKLKEWRNRD